MMSFTAVNTRTRRQVDSQTHCETGRQTDKPTKSNIQSDDKKTGSRKTFCLMQRDRCRLGQRCEATQTDNILTDKLMRRNKTPGPGGASLQSASSELTGLLASRMKYFNVDALKWKPSGSTNSFVCK